MYCNAVTERAVTDGALLDLAWATCGSTHHLVAWRPWPADHPSTGRYLIQKSAPAELPPNCGIAG
jgi:hypothetical protein